MGYALVVVLAGLRQEQDDLQKRAQELKADVTRIRKLEFPKDVAVVVYTEEELRRFVIAEFEREFPRPKAKKYEKAYRHFGLVPADEKWDLFDAIVALYRDWMAGAYHPRTKELKLLASEDAGPGAERMARITLVHELTHAAQDQNFDLVTIPTLEEYDDDLVAALKCLLEGEASIVGFRADADIAKGGDPAIRGITNEYKKANLPGQGAKLPASLRLTLYFPYGFGTEFVLDCLNGYGGDWSKIGKMYDDLPSSTEQILHPEKYWKERDNPIVITLPGLSEDRTALCRNVHGEFGIRILLKQLQAGTRTEIETAAGGWGGDRYVVCEREGKVSSVWYTTWDTEEDAKEFFDAYRNALRHKYKDAKESVGGDVTVLQIDDARAATLERRGKDVVVLDGDVELRGFSDKIWKETKKEERERVERFVAGRWTCENHPDVEKEVDAYCPECGERLTKRKEKD